MLKLRVFRVLLSILVIILPSLFFGEEIYMYRSAD
jgi:hypothetical protein